MNVDIQHLHLREDHTRCLCVHIALNTYYRYKSQSNTNKPYNNTYSRYPRNSLRLCYLYYHLMPGNN